MEGSKAESSQSDKFWDWARELECDEDETAFEAMLRKVVIPPTQPTDKGDNGGNAN